MTAENFPNFGSNASTQVQKAHRSAIKFNPKKNPPKHFIMELSKLSHKERILKAARDKEYISRNPASHKRVG
jgi:hypothetical protein